MDNHPSQKSKEAREYYAEAQHVAEYLVLVRVVEVGPGGEMYIEGVRGEENERV